MTYVPSVETEQAVDKLFYEAHKKAMKLIAVDLYQKKVTAPPAIKSIWDDDPIVHLDENGPFHVESIITFEYDHDNEEIGDIFAKVCDENGENPREVRVRTKY